jgi:hypothetical protein
MKVFYRGYVLPDEPYPEIDEEQARAEAHALLESLPTYTFTKGERSSVADMPTLGSDGSHLDATESSLDATGGAVAISARSLSVNDNDDDDDDDDDSNADDDGAPLLLHAGPSANNDEPASAGVPMHEAPACCICIDEYQEGDIVTRLPCDHEFHRECIGPWLESHRDCPLCKQDVFALHSEANGGGGEGAGPASARHGATVDDVPLLRVEDQVVAAGRAGRRGQPRPQLHSTSNPTFSDEDDDDDAIRVGVAPGVGGCRGCTSCGGGAPAAVCEGGCGSGGMQSVYESDMPGDSAA